MLIKIQESENSEKICFTKNPFKIRPLPRRLHAGDRYLRRTHRRKEQYPTEFDRQFRQKNRPTQKPRSTDPEYPSRRARHQNHSHRGFRCRTLKT